MKEPNCFIKTSNPIPMLKKLRPALFCLTPVSYTHLDVYKRQVLGARALL